MKFSCSQEELKNALSTVGRAIDTSARVVPARRNVLLEVKDGLLTLYATDLVTSITTWLPVMVEQEGSAIVMHRLLYEYINALPNNNRVDFALNDVSTNGSESYYRADWNAYDESYDENEDLWATSVLNIQSGSAISNIPTTPSNDYPATNDVTMAGSNKLSIDASVLREAINMVSYIASADTQNINMGVEFKIHENNLYLAAFEGYRLAVYSNYIDYNLDDGLKIIIPAKSLNEVARFAATEEEFVTIIVPEDNRSVLFEFSNIQLVSQLMQYNFIDYLDKIPVDWDTQCVLDVEELKNAIQLALIFARNNSRIQFDLTQSSNGQPNILNMTAHDVEFGDSTNEIEIDSLDGASNAISLNGKYIQEMLNIFRNNKVVMEMKTSNDPAVFKITSDNNAMRYCQIIAAVYTPDADVDF